jgi:hypothetical protein
MTVGLTQSRLILEIHNGSFLHYKCLEALFRLPQPSLSFLLRSSILSLIVPYLSSGFYWFLVIPFHNFTAVSRLSVRSAAWYLMFSSASWIHHSQQRNLLVLEPSCRPHQWQRRLHLTLATLSWHHCLLVSRCLSLTRRLSLSRRLSLNHLFHTYRP